MRSLLAGWIVGAALALVATAVLLPVRPFFRSTDTGMHQIPRLREQSALVLQSRVKL